MGFLRYTGGRTTTKGLEMSSRNWRRNYKPGDLSHGTWVAQFFTERVYWGVWTRKREPGGGVASSRGFTLTSLGGVCWVIEKMLDTCRLCSGFGFSSGSGRGRRTRLPSVDVTPVTTTEGVYVHESFTEGFRMSSFKFRVRPESSREVRGRPVVQSKMSRPGSHTPFWHEVDKSTSPGYPVRRWRGATESRSGSPTGRRRNDRSSRTIFNWDSGRFCWWSLVGVYPRRISWILRYIIDKHHIGFDLW